MIGGIRSTTGFWPGQLKIQDLLKKGPKLRKDLAAAKKDLAAHKQMMRQARFTPEGYKKATAKLHRLEHKVETLQKRVDNLRLIA